MTDIVSINPANGSVVGAVKATTTGDVSDAVLRARAAQVGWAATSVAERAGALHQIAAEFRQRKDELGTLQSQEMGMPNTAAVLNIERAALFLEWYADNAESGLAPVVTYDQDGEQHVVSRVPRGVHASVFAWNFPWSNMVWACGQSLVCGNAVVLKMSEEIPLSAQAFAEVVNRHVPDDVFIMVYGDGVVGQHLVSQPVDVISFTGSTTTGRSVAKIAAEQLVPVILELGGSAPGIVCEDADLDAVIDKIALARLGNAGQRCDGLKRLLVHQSRFDEVVEQLVIAFGAAKLGDPSDPATTLGPLASHRQLEAVSRQVGDAISKGARAVVGGTIDTTQVGAYCPATLLVDVTPTMRVWTEEVFAPVLPVMSFDGYDDATRLANDSDYGLGSHIYTTSAARAADLSSKLDVGMVSINGAIYTRPFNPFGGVKRSGYGREHGVWGYHELTMPKVVASTGTN